MKAILSEFFRFFKGLDRTDAYLIAVVILLALLSYGLGYWSGRETGTEGIVRICAENGASVQSYDVSSENKAGEGKASLKAAVEDANLPQEQGYVASKNGTKYHLPWCSGAQRIKEENKVWFKSKAEAEAAGYTPAANCKGL